MKKQEKLKRNCVLKAGLLNAEGIDRPGKREDMARKWEEAKLDIALIPETQHNTGGGEQFPAWGKYTVFYSTSIDPDTKAKEEAKRAATQKKGVGARPPTWAPDYENAGVAIANHKKLMPHLKVVQEIIGRLTKAVFMLKEVT